MATASMSSFELTGADGGPLRGEVRTAAHGADRPAVVICHGFKGFKDWGFFPHLAARLARGGMTAVTFNFSGSGVGTDGESFSEPERFGRATVSSDLADLNTVCDALLAGSLLPGLRGSHRARPLRPQSWRCRRAPPRRPDGAVPGAGHVGGDCGFQRWGPETLAKWRADGKLDIVNARTGDVLPLYTDCLTDLEAHGRTARSLLQAAASLEPWLIVHGEVDKTVTVREARKLHRAATQRDPVCSLSKAAVTPSVCVIRGPDRRRSSSSVWTQPWIGSSLPAVGAETRTAPGLRGPSPWGSEAGRVERVDQPRLTADGLRDNVSAAQQQTRRSERGQRDQTDTKGSNARLLVETDT